MKRFFTYLLIISIGFNLYFLFRKLERKNRDNEVMKLHFFKNITYKEGYDYFLKEIKHKYPKTDLNKKYVVYMWDSTMYDFMYEEQMKALDSMAECIGKSKLEYVFATEMEQTASERFLKTNYDAYKNVKMLYGMDDFISGLYNLKNSKTLKSKKIGSSSTNKINEDNLKQKPFYLIMDARGKVLYTNENRFCIRKDTAFLNKLSALTTDNTLNILD